MFKKMGINKCVLVDYNIVNHTIDRSNLIVLCSHINGGEPILVLVKHRESVEVVLSEIFIVFWAQD